MSSRIAEILLPPHGFFCILRVCLQFQDVLRPLSCAERAGNKGRQLFAEVAQR